LEETGLIARTTIVEICSFRDAALAKMGEAARTIAEGHRLASEAQELAQRAHGMSTFTLRDRGSDKEYQRLFERFDPAASLDVYRKQLDARVWMHVVALTGMSDLMDRTAKEQLDKDLCGSVPEFNEDAARQVFESLLGDAQLIFQRGIARTFGELDRRFKSHDGFKIGSRIILTRVFDDWGSFNYHSRMRDTMADIERVFAVMDGKKPDPGALARAIEEDRRGGWRARQSVTETPYFRIRCFQNGNAHLWFLRDDLVDKVNQVLADYFGEVLPDAAHPEDSPDDLRSKSGLPAKNLSFYPTPDAVTERCLRDVHIRPGCRVLEPSAGTGNMARILLDRGAVVDAVEIDPGRAAVLRLLARNPNLTVHERNFLAMPAVPEYDFVVMNPPFYDTHWMEHVVHAYDFLVPGGTLVAVLPVSAETGESKKHETFRAWAQSRSRGYGHMFHDLPAESFAESGTRVNTVVFTLRK
jgi:hypothetical protein